MRNGRASSFARSCLGTRRDNAMAKPLDEWKVFPHGPIEELEPNLWRVEANVPGAPMKRVFTIVKTADGRLALHNPIALEEAAMKKIEAWGTPAFLIAPNAMHR